MSDRTHIFTWRGLSGTLTTSGQLSEEGLASIYALSVEHIANQELHTHEKALHDEAAIEPVWRPGGVWAAFLGDGNAIERIVRPLLRRGPKLKRIEAVTAQLSDQHDLDGHSENQGVVGALPPRGRALRRLVKNETSLPSVATNSLRGHFYHREAPMFVVDR